MYHMDSVSNNWSRELDNAKFVSVILTEKYNKFLEHESRALSWKMQRYDTRISKFVERFHRYVDEL